MSKSSDEEKEKFLAWVEKLPVTSRSYVTHSLTDGQLYNDIYMYICEEIKFFDSLKLNRSI